MYLPSNLYGSEIDSNLVQLDFGTEKETQHNVSQWTCESLRLNEMFYNANEGVVCACGSSVGHAVQKPAQAVWMAPGPLA